MQMQSFQSPILGCVVVEVTLVLILTCFHHYFGTSHRLDRPEVGATVYIGLFLACVLVSIALGLSVNVNSPNHASQKWVEASVQCAFSILVTTEVSSHSMSSIP